MARIVIFVSGSGSNAENIIQYFENDPRVTVAAILSNNRKAGIWDRDCMKHTGGITFNRMSFYKTEHILQLLQGMAPDLIVLAGFLWKFPENLLKAFPDKVINIHPALLPKYGGKGMYGMHIHNEVVKNGEKETGITIHYVNEQYDEGKIIFQKSIEVTPQDTPERVAEKIHQLEYAHFPLIIEKLLYGTN